MVLTLREVHGLTREEITHVFLIPTPALVQRSVRVIGKFGDARTAYQQVFQFAKQEPK